MLFYQRRGNAETLDIQGDAPQTVLPGTIYAKWSRFKLSGQGT